MPTTKRTSEVWENIDYLVNGHGDITIGSVGPIRCAAVAADAHHSMAMLVRRPRESLEDLLTRLDEAIRKAMEEDEFTDEINP
jgi:class 3 adenylate cyclase